MIYKAFVYPPSAPRRYVQRNFSEDGSFNEDGRIHGEGGTTAVQSTQLTNLPI